VRRENLFLVPTVPVGIHTPLHDHRMYSHTEAWEQGNHQKPLRTSASSAVKKLDSNHVFNKRGSLDGFINRYQDFQ